MAKNFFKIDQGLNLPTKTLPVAPTEGDVAKDSVDNKFKFYENGVWKKLGSGSGSGTGAEVIDLRFQAELQDSINEPLNGNTPIDISANKTDAAFYSSVNEYMRFSYDAVKTLTGTGTTMSLSAAPAFAVRVGDVIVCGGEVREITALGSINTTGAGFTIASAFSVNPSAAQATVSQAVYTQDLNAFTAGGTGLAISSQITSNVNVVMVNYDDSTTLNDVIPDWGSVPHIAYSVSADNSTWSLPKVRPTSLTGQVTAVAVPTPGTQFRIRFFANKTSGSGLVNLLGYKVFWHEQMSDASGSSYNTAFARPTSSLFVNATHAVVSGKSRFTFPFSYPRGLSAGNPSGSAIEVFANGQQVPRFQVGITDAAQAYFTEISENIVEMDTDYTSAGLEFMFKVPVVVVDSNSSNTNRIATLEALLANSQETTLSLAGSGSYTAGSIKVVRLGNQVTISALSNLTHASNSQPVSAIGLLPVWARPSVVKYNVYLVTTSGSLYRVDISPNGQLGTVYFNSSLALNSLVDASNGLTISFSI